MNAAAATEAAFEKGCGAGLAPCGEASQPEGAAAIELLATLPATLPLLLQRPADGGGWGAVKDAAREASAAEDKRAFGGRDDLVCLREIWISCGAGSMLPDADLAVAVAGRPLLLPFGGALGWVGTVGASAELGREPIVLKSREVIVSLEGSDTSEPSVCSSLAATAITTTATASVFASGFSCPWASARTGTLVPLTLPATPSLIASLPLLVWATP